MVKVAREMVKLQKLTLWKFGRLETIFTYGVAAALVLAIIAFIGDEAAHHINAFEAWIDGMGPSAIVVFVLLSVLLVSIFIPDSLIGIVAGATFGFSQGLMVVICCNLLAAALQFALARRLLKPFIDRLLAKRPALAAIQAAVMKQELRLQLLIRLTPLNRAVTNYVLGAAGVRFNGFMAACVALLPTIFLEVYFGYAGKHLVKIAGASSHDADLHDIVLVAGLSVAIAVMVLISRLARKALENASAAAASDRATVISGNAKGSR